MISTPIFVVNSSTLYTYKREYIASSQVLKLFPVKIRAHKFRLLEMIRINYKKERGIGKDGRQVLVSETLEELLVEAGTRFKSKYLKQQREENNSDSANNNDKEIILQQDAVNDVPDDESVDLDDKYLDYNVSPYDDCEPEKLLSKKYNLQDILNIAASVQDISVMDKIYGEILAARQNYEIEGEKEEHEVVEFEITEMLLEGPEDSTEEPAVKKS
jgi:hypothetical protein